MKPIRYIVETGSADAVIFNQTQPEDPRVAWLMDRHFPFATHGRTNWADRHAWFDYDNLAFGRLAVESLHARGRRNIMLVAPPMMQTYAQHIVLGARSAALMLGVQLSETNTYSSDSGSEVVRAGAAATLAEHPEIDGFICSSTSAVMAVVAALEAAGRTLGQDIDVFGKEAIPFLRLFRPQIMALKEDVSQAGEFLARAAIQAVREPDLPPLQGLDVPLALG
jgi:LacI family transcriptional regulator